MSEATLITSDHGIWARGATVVPTSVIRRTDLSHGAKFCYALLLSYAWRDGSCFPGVETLARDLGVHQNTARAYIDELVVVGLVVKVRRGRGQPNLYILPGSVSEARPNVPIPPSAPKGDGTRAARARDPLFDAICRVTRTDPATAGASVGKVKKALLSASPPFGEKEVVAFETWWWADPWRKRRGQPPSLWTLQERIGVVRGTHPESDEPPDNGHEADDDQLQRDLELASARAQGFA